MLSFMALACSILILLNNWGQVVVCGEQAKNLHVP
jgi:hypothetical protein